MDVSAGETGAIELSVVVPAFNAAETIGEQLRALSNQEWSGEWEVVVADNGSTDETARVVALVAAEDPRIRLIDAGDAPGPSHARNCGVTASRGRSIAFCDADDVVSEEWVRAIGEALREHAFVTGPQEFEKLNPPWLWGLYGTRPAYELQTFEQIFPFGPAANLGVRRTALEDIGGFDVSIVPGEDLDVCLRLWLRGEQLHFIPEAVVHYRYRQDLRSIWRQAVAYGTVSPAIAKRLALHGRSTPSRWRGIRRLGWLARNSIRLGNPGSRARWVVAAGTLVGHIKGSLRARWFMV